MNAYRLTLTLKSPLGTPLAADTLFGHICWSLVYYEGDPDLPSVTEFLATMQSDSPPLLLSDPFPAGFLPAPVLPAEPPGANDSPLKALWRQTPWQALRRIGIEPPGNAVETQPPQTELDFQHIAKQIKRLAWLPADLLTQQTGPLSIADLLKKWLAQPYAGNSGPAILPQPGLSPHNVINRMSGVSENLFFSRDSFFAGRSIDYDLYLWSDRFSAAVLQKLLANALAGGYGRDKSTGRGVIDVGDCQPADWPAGGQPNAVMLLGPCLPAAADPSDGYWQIHAKAPKLGGPWAVGVGPDGQTHNPYKYPMVMLRAGSVLCTDTPRLYYGRVADKVHHQFDQIVQYGLAPALPIQLTNSPSESEVV